MDMIVSGTGAKDARDREAEVRTHLNTCQGCPRCGVPDICELIRL